MFVGRTCNPTQKAQGHGLKVDSIHLLITSNAHEEQHLQGNTYWPFKPHYTHKAEIFE